MVKPSIINWLQIERQYRAGVLSIREIAREHAVPESTIRLRAKEEKWTRDLTKDVQQRTRAKLIESLANPDNTDAALKQLKENTDEEILEQAAKTQVTVVREHQRTLGTGHKLTLRMLDELDATTSLKGELADLIVAKNDIKNAKALLRAVSLGGRAAVMRDLAQAARTWVTLERQAFGIADDKRRETDDRLNEMTADELRAQILAEAKELGIIHHLPTDFVNEGVIPRANGKTTH